MKKLNPKVISVLKKNMDIEDYMNRCTRCFLDSAYNLGYDCVDISAILGLYDMKVKGCSGARAAARKIIKEKYGRVLNI